MSEPKRYKVGKIGTTEMIDCVSYESHARLKAEVHRLEEIVGSDAIDRKYGMCCDASDEVARLKAEVERLTKAVMHSPAAQLKLKELEGKTTYEEINPDNR